VLILAPAEMPKAPFVDVVPLALATALRAHNQTHPIEERIRLRMALHAGEVQFDRHGVTATSVNLAFRLLDARSLKTALAESSGVLALISSSTQFWASDQCVCVVDMSSTWAPSQGLGAGCSGVVDL
jgi:class 3 adenylate cyclase